ncbi:conjugal transfer protein TraP [Serratia fonticola]|uniref:conjugal transfer protein TraP n=1 Tax=Serratia fonticola TaxID=47917 RepID=UPI001645D182|nr:conjugal transfer protein TraP [Serratia fonticola]MBC3219719.1 conjugal transfer protein TraP [Serratia fonticola]
MSEFSTIPTVSTPPEAPPTPSTPSRPRLLQRKLLFDMTLPWLAGALLALGLFAAYLFAPYVNGGDGGSAATQDAFSEAEYGQSVAPVALAAVAPAGGTDAVQLQNDVATMVGGVRSFAETNRTAISRLADTVKTQSTALAALKQQLADLQAQNNHLLSRLSVLEAKPAAVVSQVNDRVAPRSRSALAGMRLDAVQNGMAWVYWQGKTWAVKAGDRLGRVTITGIDAQSREVSTSAGVLK